MKEEEREELSKRSNALRLELKVWEKQFASANNGEKASRSDIKENPDIGIYSCHEYRRQSNISYSAEI